MRDAKARLLATEQAVNSGVLAAFSDEYAKRRSRQIEREAEHQTPRKPPDLARVATAMAIDLPGSVVPRKDH